MKYRILSLLFIVLSCIIASANFIGNDNKIRLSATKHSSCAKRFLLEAKQFIRSNVPRNEWQREVNQLFNEEESGYTYYVPLIEFRHKIIEQHRALDRDIYDSEYLFNSIGGPILRFFGRKPLTYGDFCDD